MFDISLLEIVVVMVVLLLVLRPEDIPGVMRGIGRTLRVIKSYVNDITSLFDDEKRAIRSEYDGIVDEIQDADGTSIPLYDTDSSSKPSK